MTQRKEPEKEQVNPPEQKQRQQKQKSATNTQDKERIAELTDRLARLQAEFENYKKYIDKKSGEHRDYANAQLINEMLPLIDSFQEALKHTSNCEEFIRGVQLIYSQFMNILEKEGLKPIECLGKPVDPFKHEVLTQESSDKEPGIVLDELQRGYTLKGNVLRYAKVKVSKEKTGEANGKAL